MSAIHSRVVEDHEGDLSSSWEPTLLLGFLFLETDLLLELGYSGWSCSEQKQSSPSSISKFEKFFPETDRENFNSSNESTISTSLTHNIASDGKSEQVVTWFLSRIFQN